MAFLIGAAAIGYLLPISIVVVVLLIIVVASYRQTPASTSHRRGCG